MNPLDPTLDPTLDPASRSAHGRAPQAHANHHANPHANSQSHPLNSDAALHQHARTAAPGAAPTGSRSLQQLAPAAFARHGRLMQAQPSQQQQGGGGGKGDSPPPPPPVVTAPPPPPEVADVEAAKDDATNAVLRRKGALATNVTGPNGADTPATSGKTLLGA